MIIRDGVEQTRPELATHDAAIKADVGDFSGQSNLQTLLAALGIPDTAGKPLYTVLVTDRLDDATYGLSAIQVDLAAVNADIGDYSAQTNLQSLLAALGIPDVAGKDLHTLLVTDRLDNATYGLSALNDDIDAIQTDLGDYSAQTNLQSLLAALGIPDTAGKPLYTVLVTDRLDDATYGLSAIQVDVAAIQTDLGDFSGQTNLQTLLAVLGVPDVAGKPLYTTIITDRLDDATIGLAQIASDVVGIGGDAMRGTDSAALASVVGALADAAASGDPTSVDTLMQYAKQLVNVLVGADGVAAWSGGAAPAANVSIHEVIEQLYDDLALVLADTGTDGVVLGTKVASYKLLAGENQIAITTEDLNQAAGSYDLFTGTTQAVLLKGFSIKMPADLCDDTTLTSISIQTDDATPGIIISSTNGAVINLTSEAELSWTGLMRINAGTKIQLTIAGGAEGAEYITTVTARYEAIVDGGYLAV